MSAHSCDHHHDHDAAPPLERRLSDAEAVCAGRGARLTEQRRVVLAALIEARRALGAYDLIESVAKATGKRTAPITIYRALDFLSEMGLVHRIESKNAFLACPAGHGPHGLAVFMICDCCGRVDEANSPDLEKLLGRIARERGFAPQGRMIEMAGRCAACGEA